MSKLNGYKTYLVAAATIAYAWLSVWKGGMDASHAVDMTLAACGLAGLRHGISTSAQS